MLGQCLFGKHRGNPLGTFSPWRRVEQDELKDPFHVLLGGAAQCHLLSGPVQAIGEHDGASQAMIHQPLPGSRIKIELESPAAVVACDLAADQFFQVLAG